MSAKNLDKHNHFRCITIGFRVSPEEHEHINKAVALSGLSKQEYCYRRCLERDIVVQGNPKVYKALKDQLAEVLEELNRIEAGQSFDDELLENINLITRTLQEGAGCTMKNVNYKKLILPNIPYVFIALLATKLGQAVRLSPGTDFSSKLLNILEGMHWHLRMLCRTSIRFTCS